MAKVNNNSVRKKKPPKEMSWYDSFKFLGSWKENKVSDAFIEKLCGELAEHFEKPQNICVFKFTSDRGINFSTFKVWVKRYPKLAELYEVILQRIGSRREKLAVYKEYECNPSALNYTMRHYNPHWMDSYVADSDLRLKASEKGSNETKVVVIEKFPESDGK